MTTMTCRQPRPWRALLFLLLLALWAGACATGGKAPSEPAPDQESEAELFNTLRWSTASEVDNFGFDVYRATSPDGPFTRLTELPIEGAGTSDEENHYSFVDETNDPRVTYYYYVESISMSGERERFTPVAKVEAKLTEDG